MPAEWTDRPGPEETDAEPTVLDQLGDELAEFAGWAAQDKAWTVHEMAVELYSLGHVATPEDLASYKSSVLKQYEALRIVPRTRRTELAGALTLHHLDPAIEVLRLLEWEEVRRAVMRLEAAEADRQSGAGRDDRAREAEQRALEIGDLEPDG